MKSKLLILLFITCLFPISAISQQTNPNDDGEWYPFVIPEKLDPDSPMNIGKLVLDPPAGKHGFCKVKGSNFYFENGTLAKFWGTNLCMSACFPSHKEAEDVANRLAFFGFNAVRLHQMDWDFEPNGIFFDADPKEKNFQNKSCSLLSEKQLEKLDYLIYQLKLRGIYVNLNLLVSRRFTLRNGIIDADKLPRAAKPASLFNKQLISLQKEYAFSLLNHYNPYTKLRYSDEPAIALIEITNENSLFDYFDSKNQIKKTVPDFYKTELSSMIKSAFNSSLLSNNLIGIEKSYFIEMTSFLRETLQIKIPIAGNSGYWSKNNLAAQASCDFIDTHYYWDHPKFINRNWDINDFSIHNQSIFLKGRIAMAKTLASRLLPDRPTTISEWNHCYPNMFAYETPITLALLSIKNGWDALFQFNYNDYSLNDQQTKPRIKNFFVIKNNPQQLILSSFASYLTNKGNDAYMALNNDYIKIQSSHAIGYIGSIKNKVLDFGYIKITANQDGVLLMRAFDNSQISHSKHLLFIILSEVKNFGSEWKSASGYTWGTDPTMLKNINLELYYDKKDSLGVYEININGKRTKNLVTNADMPRIILNNITSPYLEVCLGQN